MTVTIAQLDAFVALLGEHVQGYVFNYELKWKFIRILQTPVFNGTPQYSQRSCYCFVRVEDGAILKAASWKGPSKGVRAWLAEVMEDPSCIGHTWLYR